MRTNAILRPELAMLATEYDENAVSAGFIGGQILPYWQTPVPTATYPVMPLEMIYKVYSTIRAPRTEPNKAEYTFRTETFSTEEHAWVEEIDDTERKLFSDYFEADMIAAQRGAITMLRAHEKTVANIVMNESNVGLVKTLPKKWTDPDADFVADVKLAIQDMRLSRGAVPNVLVMSETIFNSLINKALIQNYLKGFGGNDYLINGRANQIAILATLFGIPQLLIPSAIYDTSPEGKTASLADIWSNNYVALIQTSNGRDLRSPQFGRTFVWTKRSGGGSDYIVDESYRNEPAMSDAYRFRRYVQANVMWKSCLTLLKGVL